MNGVRYLSNLEKIKSPDNKTKTYKQMELHNVRPGASMWASPEPPVKSSDSVQIRVNWKDAPAMPRYTSKSTKKKEYFWLAQKVERSLLFSKESSIWLVEIDRTNYM